MVWSLPKKTGIVTYSSGGHPGAILLTGIPGENSEVKSLVTKNIAIGIQSEFSFREEACKIEKPSRLYVFSDGAYEIRTKENKGWKLSEFEEFLSNIRDEHKSVLDHLLEHTRQLSLMVDFEDDYTIMEVKIS